jgi:hypothetical protein
VAPVAPPEVAPEASEPVVSAAVEPIRKPISNVRIVGIVSGAAGVAGIVAGTVCWLTAKNRHDEAMTNVNRNYDEAQKQQGEAHDFVTASNISFIAGGVLAALGVVLYFVGAPDGQTPTSSTHAHLIPVAGPGFAGVNAGGTW